MVKCVNGRVWKSLINLQNRCKLSNYMPTGKSPLSFYLWNAPFSLQQNHQRSCHCCQAEEPQITESEQAVVSRSPGTKKAGRLGGLVLGRGRRGTSFVKLGRAERRKERKEEAKEKKRLWLLDNSAIPYIQEKRTSRCIQLWMNKKIQEGSYEKNP